MSRLGYRALLASIAAIAANLIPTSAHAVTATITTSVTDAVGTSEFCFQHPY